MPARGNGYREQTKNGRCKEVAKRQDLASAVKSDFVEGGERALLSGRCGHLDDSCCKCSVVLGVESLKMVMSGMVGSRLDARR